MGRQVLLEDPIYYSTFVVLSLLGVGFPLEAFLLG